MVRKRCRPQERRRTGGDDGVSPLRLHRKPLPLAAIRRLTPPRWRGSDMQRELEKESTSSSPTVGGGHEGGRRSLRSLRHSCRRHKLKMLICHRQKHEKLVFSLRLANHLFSPCQCLRQECRRLLKLAPFPQAWPSGGDDVKSVRPLAPKACAQLSQVWPPPPAGEVGWGHWGLVTK